MENGATNTVEYDVSPIGQPVSSASMGWSDGLPGLHSWKTSVGGSFLGLILLIACNTLLNAAEYLPLEAYLLFLPVPFVLTIVQIIYALVIYPSYFGPNPKVRSSFAISLLNFFFGGPLFGALWNHNLTKRNKGISNIVITVLLIVDLAYALYMLAIAFSMM